METKENRHNRMECVSCKYIFDIKDAQIKIRNYAGISISEKRCPRCGGRFQAIELPSDLDRYLYVNYDNKYYEYK